MVAMLTQDLYQPTNIHIQPLQANGASRQLNLTIRLALRLVDLRCRGECEGRVRGRFELDGGYGYHLGDFGILCVVVWAPVVHFEEERGIGG